MPGFCAEPGERGIVAYECLAGVQPFSGIPVEVALAHRDRLLPPLPAAVPGEVAALVTELTAKDPADRPVSADQVAARAGRLRDGMTGGTAVLLDFWPGPPPVTLADVPLPDPPAPGKPARTRLPGRALALAAGGVVAVVLLGLLLAGVFSSESPTARTPKAGPSTVSTMVEVNSGSLSGQPVGTVRQRLRQLGLVVRLLWRPSDQQAPGTVLSVRPSGRVPPGSQVVVTGALQPHRHGHGHGGGGGD